MPFLRRRAAARSADAGQPFSAAWLAIREPFDARARDRNLARRFAGMLPQQPAILELGAGTGSLFRWLAPILARPQHWIWLDNDEAHLQHGLALTAAWARRLSYAVRHDPQGSALSIATRCGTWNIETRCQDLSDAETLPLDDADAAVCSALLDLVSEEWLGDLLYALGGMPFYAAMNVTRGQWVNRQRTGDALVRRGYRRTQAGNSSRLGCDAADAAALIASGFPLQCFDARSDWTIRPRDRAMLRHMLGFFADGAREALPQHCHRIDRWERIRQRDVEAARLAMRIAHRDILISSPDKGSRHAARRRR